MKVKNYDLAYSNKLVLLLFVSLFANVTLVYSSANFGVNPNLKFTNSKLPESISLKETFEIHRFWLSLYQNNNSVGQMLVGYATGATQGVDNGIDALYFNDSPLALTSLINNNEYIIQGRSLPFLDTDIVPLGFKTDSEGSFTIALSNFDGLFLTNQAIFLKDKVTGVLQNLKVASYTFTSQIGVFNNRFEIRYKSDTTTYQEGAWDNGIPTIAMNAVILDDFTTSADLSTKSLNIKPDTFFTIASGTTLTVESELINEAGINNFIIENDAVLLQNSNLPNSALATVKRNSYNLFRQDYTLWSSPVFEPNLRNFSPATLFNRFSSYNFDTSVNGAYKQEIFTNADVINKKFISAKGYLIRMPNNATEYAIGASPQSFQGVFKGILNNGLITIPLYGIVPSVSNGLNLVGNPYPSPISIATFFDANPSIETTLYFWRKQASANPANSSVSGYATYTSMGFVSPDVTINNIAPSNIQTGQGFFVIAKSAFPGNLVFNNEMRTNGATTFFKSANDSSELHRFWLNLSNATDVVGQTLIGYKTGATQNSDKGIDAKYFNDSSLALTSLINNNEYIIQGRNLPFLITDVVPLGFKSNSVGSFTISLFNFDGLFAENQPIYLRDNTTGSIQDLKLSDYTFTTESGVFNERFEIHYTNTTLETESPILTNNNLLVSVKNQKIQVNAGTLIMDKIEVIDSSGRIIYRKQGVNATTATLENIFTMNQILILRITTKENAVLTQKILF